MQERYRRRRHCRRRENAACRSSAALQGIGKMLDIEGPSTRPPPVCARVASLPVVAPARIGGYLCMTGSAPKSVLRQGSRGTPCHGTKPGHVAFASHGHTTRRLRTADWCCITKRSAFSRSVLATWFPTCVLLPFDCRRHTPSPTPAARPKPPFESWRTLTGCRCRPPCAQQCCTAGTPASADEVGRDAQRGTNTVAEPPDPRPVCRCVPMFLHPDLRRTREVYSPWPGV